MRNKLWLGVPVVIALGLMLSSVSVADEDCTACHDETVKAWAKTAHGRQFSARAGYADAGCKSCHANTEAHIESGGDTKPTSLHLGADADATCLNCHGNDRRHAQWSGSTHQGAGVACAACHNPHQLPAEAGRRTNGPDPQSARCLQCHSGQRAMLHQRSAHPLAEGQMKCSSCHDPHGTTGEKLIAQGSVNELCYSCHANTRGPFLWEHSPVREDCLNCHSPHGSNYPQLLKARTTQLCQSCHQQGRHQTVAGLPQSAWLGNKACLNCHQNIHGSNHPSGPLFQR